MKQVFESDSILFVEVSELLIPDYLAMINDYENVGRFIGRNARKSANVITEESERAWVQKKLAEKAALFSMIEKESGEFIGNLELMDVNGGSAELGIAITATKQDKGYGTEAIQAMTKYGMGQLALNRIVLKVYPDNARAIHVYEKCGFREYDRTDEDVFMEMIR